MTVATHSLLRESIGSVPDFPTPGIDFKDITPLLSDGEKFGLAVDELCGRLSDLAIEFDAVAVIEARGFLFGAPVASRLRRGLLLVRKPGKLPHKKVSMSYDLEYGRDTLEMHADAVVRGQRVLVVDDLLATGGTMKACCDLVAGLGGEVAGVAVLIELAGLGGRQKLPPCPVHTVLRYD